MTERYSKMRSGDIALSFLNLFGLLVTTIFVSYVMLRVNNPDSLQLYIWDNIKGAIILCLIYAGLYLCRLNRRIAYRFSDHLGNNRVDIADYGGVWQAMDYYPFGMPMASSYLPGKQRWLFGGKEFDRTSGLDLYDQDARAYDPTLGRFRNPDPLAEKYHPISPYLFCAANPLLYVDPSGLKIEFVDTSDTEFIKAFNEAWRILRSYGCSQNIDYLNEMNECVYVQHGYNEKHQQSCFSTGEKIITWVPNIGLEIHNIDNTTYFLSPAEILQHEADHAAQYFKHKEKMFEDGQSISGNAYGCMEEERVISGSETTTAIAMGRLQEGRQTRYDHLGTQRLVTSLVATKNDVVEAVAVAKAPEKPAISTRIILNYNIPSKPVLKITK